MDEIYTPLREKSQMPERMLYPAQVHFRYVGKIKTFQTHKTKRIYDNLRYLSRNAEVLSKPNEMC